MTADQRAFRIIMGPSKGQKQVIVTFALSLSEQETEEATNTFHRQGPRLWGFWCQAMRQRRKAGLPVPKVFQG